MTEGAPGAGGRGSRYHHGDLRAALLAEASRQIAERGVASLSLRAVAASVGVSNAAPVHHFRDKAGLLTALAAEGYRLLTDELQRAWDEHRSMLEVGVAYVGFAVAHGAYFDVMYRADLHRPDDPELRAAREGAGRVLYGAAASVERASGGDTRRAGVAGWALMHGIAELWRSGDLPRDIGDDPRAVARELGLYLFQRGRR